MNLKHHFERRYLESLEAHRFFYDDVREYGRPDETDYVFYFIPGLNGVPGQIRFALPGFHTVFGNNFHIQCLYLPEFAARRPIWAKYTAENLEKRQAAIEADLLRLASRHDRVHVVASSTGFYEFAAAVAGLPRRVRDVLILLWVAAAPDRFAPTRWEAVFAPLNGLDRNGCRWTALPNHNAFAALNAEARSTFRWRNSGAAQTLYKGNLESRFPAFGLSWAYFSIDCTNRVLCQCVERISQPLDIDAYVLAGTRDGYWQGKSPHEMTDVIGRYLARPVFLWKPASHLWINIPENVSELLTMATRKSTANASPISPIAM